MGRRNASGGGLSSLELLSLPEDQGKIARWLTRQKQATFDEIQTAMSAQKPAAVHAGLAGADRRWRS
ncbi:MAG: hypothetical protein U0528_05115 [Anaerolineae bacterium]